MLWEWFWELRDGVAPGFNGPSPISHAEIVAWLGLTGNILRREEVKILKAMSSSYCIAIDKESEAIREREAEPR